MNKLYIITFAPIIYILFARAFLVSSLPHEQIRTKGQDCNWEFRPYNISLNLKNLTNGVDEILVPDGQSKTLLIGLCKGMNITCQGKKNKGTSSCLINKSPLKADEINNLGADNSTIIGHVSKSHIRLLNNRMIYETISYNKTCADPNDKTSNLRPYSTQVQFHCANVTESQPSFKKFENCTYFLEWPTLPMCKVEELIKIGNSNNRKVTIINKNSSSIAATTDEIHPSINLEPKPKSGAELHNETLIDAKQLLEPSQNVTAHQIDTNTTTTNINSTTKAPPVVDVNEKKVVNITKEDKENQNHKQDNSAHQGQKSNNVVLNETKENPSVSTPTKGPQPANKMNKFHKLFMIASIVICLAGFVVVIFILDKKTSFGVPIGEIGRRARQVLRPEPVPYTRVDRFNDCLNL